MATSIPVKEGDKTAPTPQNTPLQAAPITLGLSRPTVPDIAEGEGEDGEEDDAPGGAAFSAAALAALSEGRLSHLIGRSSGYIESLPVPVKRSVEGLKGVQVQYNALQAAYKRECWELEKKFSELQRPLYERRKEIIAGTSAPTAEEIEQGEKLTKEDDPEFEGLPAEEAGTAAIPNFWLTALNNHPELSEIITEKDSEVLKHLIDVRLSYLPSDPDLGYKLTFTFSPNDYFENTELEKTYVYQKDLGYGGDFLYAKATGTEIKWKSEEKDLTKVVEVKKQRNKNTNRTRLVKKTRPADSFFNFFSPPIPPASEEEEDNMDEDDLADLEMKLEVDYQIGEDFKEKIIPRAVDYFTGKALEYESMDEDDDFDDEFDDDDDEDDSDDEPRPARGKRGARGAAAGGEAVDPETCKQQ